MCSFCPQAVLAFLICVSPWPFVSVAQGYSDGSGTVDEPYEIASKQDILQLASTPADCNRNFVLTADIDMAGDVHPAALIASDMTAAATYQGVPFTGTLDGQKHSISNLTIDTAGSPYSYLGLFGRLGEGARVRNLRLKNFTINQTAWSACFGALAGDMTKDCEIYRVEVTNANVSGPDKAGLLVGQCAGVITNSHAQGTLTGHSACGGFVGNLIGDDPFDFRDDGIIELCSSAGAIQATTQAGGFVGTSQNISKISQSLSSVHVTGRSNAQKIGGFAGEVIGGVIVDCRATGDVATGANSIEIGGFIGQTGPGISYPGFILATYCRNSVTYGPASSQLGGYAGASLGSILYYNYYLSPADWNLINGIATVLTDTQMQTQASFENWNFQDVWTMKIYPVLAWENGTEFSKFAALASFWQQTGCYTGQPCAAVDWCADGAIDAKDLGQLAACWLGYGVDVVCPTYYDDFETGDFTALNWVHTPGATPWKIVSDEVYEGSHAAHADAVGSILELTVYVPADYRISFQYKVSTHNLAPDDYVSLFFYIGGATNSEWRGEYPWSRHSVNVAPGLYTFKWNLSKSVFASQDWGFAWLDNIQLEKIN
jgi:hypothetical protein